MPFSNKAVLPVLPKVKNARNESSDNPSLSSIEDKELRKKLRNRQSALAARERKKARMLELEKQVATLQESKKRLQDENQALRLRVDVLTQKCLEAGLSFDGEKDPFSWTHRPAEIQSKYPADSAYNSSTPGHSAYNSERFAQQGYFVTQESYFQNQFLRLQNPQQSFGAYGSYQMKFKSYEDVKKKPEHCPNSLLSCQLANIQANKNHYSPVYPYSVESECQVNQSTSVKLEGISHFGSQKEGRHPSAVTGFSQGEISTNPNWMDSNEKLDFDNFSLAQLPSIGVLWETGQKLARRDTKSRSQSNLPLENHFSLSCEESFQPNSNHPDFSTEGNLSNCRKLKSFHSADEVSCSKRNAWLNCATQSCYFESGLNNRQSADKSNRSSLSALPSPANCEGLQSNFSDFNFTEATDAVDFDFVTFKEEANELLSCRSDSGVSMDEYPYWAADPSS